MTTLVFGETVMCTFCGGRGKARSKYRPKHPCPYCKGRGVYSIHVERAFLLMPSNVRVRTTLADGDALNMRFDWAHEADIRAKAVELHHDKLSEMKVGESIGWEYQGFSFVTTVIERREPPNLQMKVG